MTKITVVVLTLNEEANIERCLTSAVSIGPVLVVDSHSTDRTVEIAERFASCSVVQRRWRGFSDQRNWALDQVRHLAEWVVFLDADEYFPIEDAETLKAEIVGADDDVAGLVLNRYLHFCGADLLRFRVALMRVCRPKLARWESRDINEHLLVYGKTAQSRARLIHDDAKPVSHWLGRQVEYAGREVQRYGYTTPGDELSVLDIRTRLRRSIREAVWPRVPGKPLVRFVYFYLLKGLCWDGRAGYLYALEQGANEVHKAVIALEIRNRPR